mgnify:CR=1 FL=1
MKKLFLLLILSFFSAQGLAAGCPDGSEPVRSISADGTYFVFNCGGSADSSNETSKTKSNGLVPNTLKQIKVIKDWEPVSDFKALKEYAFNEYKYRWNYDEVSTMGCKNRMEKMDPYPGTGTQYSSDTRGVGGGDTNTVWFGRCQGYYHDLATKKPQIIGDVLLEWASNKKDPLVVIHNPDIAMQTAGYQIPSVLGTFTQFYALWYDEINYTSEERELVDSYLTKKLMEQKFPVLNAGTKPCDINNINSVLDTKRTGTNSCGNTRQKVSAGEIMLGFRLENQILLDKGHDDIYVVHAFINKDGVNLNHASRGANTVNYSWDYTQYMTILAEIYKTVDYDFYEHTLPHGAKVHEYLDFNYRLLKDFTLTKEWAKYNVGSFSNPYSFISNLTQEQYEIEPDYGDSYSYKYGDYEFVKTHPRFVKRYMPDLYAQFNTKEIRSFMQSNMMIGVNRGVSPYMLYLGNLSLEDKIYAEKIDLRIAEKTAQELSIFETEGQTLSLKPDLVDFVEINPRNIPNRNKIKTFQLHKASISGRLRIRADSTKKINLNALVYKMAENAADRIPPNEQRLVMLVNEVAPFRRHHTSLQKKCGSDLVIGQWLSFISKTNNPSNAVKQQCHYDYFKEANDQEAFELFQAVLSGTDSILNYLQTGKSSEVLIKEEAKEIETASELSIFKINDKTFNLTLDKVDFIETWPFKLERSAEYLKPWQLHKAAVQGSLRMKNSKKINFNSLVFKQADTKEKKLVINVGEMSIERHSDSLQKKCGPKVMEWGWLSFISQTNDIKSAKNQQCIYDYFKEANDKESFDLFQAVLGGTDSILDYLQTNVEP